MRRLILATGCVLALAGPAAAQPAATPETRGAALAMAETLGIRGQVEAMLMQMRSALVAALRPQAQRLSEAQVAELVDQYLMPEFRAHSGDILELTVSIYAARLTVEEMQQIVAFYATPLGMKLLAMLPDIAAESYRFGQAWGQRVAGEAIAKHRDALRARGINL